MTAAAFTEPDSGSDSGSMITKATKVDGGYILNGAKAWCTYANRANFLTVLARTDPDTSKRHKGLSIFLVEKEPGDDIIHPNIKASYGLLGTTFGGNHLACAATLAVIETLKEEKLMNHALQMETYFRNQAQNLKGLKAIKGRGLMLGLEFDFPIATLRKRLIFEHHIFTGSAKNPNVIRILPPLNIQKTHIDQLINALKTLL